MLIEFDLNVKYVEMVLRGVVLINHPYLLTDIPGFNRYPYFKSNTDIRAYNGVCDNVVNLLEVYPELLYEGTYCRNFVVFLFYISPYDDSLCDFSLGGYFGSKISQTAYLLNTHNEILCGFHIYEKFPELVSKS